MLNNDGFIGGSLLTFEQQAALRKAKNAKTYAITNKTKRKNTVKPDVETRIFEAAAEAQETAAN